MAFGFSGSKSGSDSDSSFEQNVWEGQAPWLQDMYGSAGGLYDQTNANMQGMIPGAQQDIGQVANQANDYWQNQAQGGVYQNMGLQNSLMNSLNQSMNNPSQTSQMYASMMGGQGNDYLDAMKASMNLDANNAMNAVDARQDARAAASGMSGGSRHGMTTSQGYKDINDALMQGQAKMGYDTYNQDLNNKLNIAQMADTNLLANQQMMQQMLGNQQATQNTGYSNALTQQGLSLGQFAPSMMPWDAMGAYASALGGPTILNSGQESSSSDSMSGGFGF